jgi:hypothetical protein
LLQSEFGTAEKRDTNTNSIKKSPQKNKITSKQRDNNSYNTIQMQQNKNLVFELGLYMVLGRPWLQYLYYIPVKSLRQTAVERKLNNIKKKFNENESINFVWKIGKWLCKEFFQGKKRTRLSYGIRSSHAL